MEKFTNKFNKGMSQDMAPSYQPEGTYFEAFNLRPVTDGGKTTGALVNVLGNTQFIEFPTTSNVIEIKNNGITGAYSFTLTINAVVVTVTGTYISDEDLYSTIAGAINADATLSSALVLIKGYYSASHAVITAVVDPLTNLIPTTVITLISSTGLLTIDTSYVQSVVTPQQLGWGRIRETLYYFTCDDSGTGVGASQIWSLTYDKINPIVAGTSPTLTLLYNNNMQLSLDHPIAYGSMIIGRYETSAVQRLYWTDDENVPRKLNVVDPQVFAVDLSQLEWVPNILFNLPILQEILQSGGSVKSGVYQFAYALSSSGGAQTGYSIPSNEVQIYNTGEASRFDDYHPDGINTATSKQIKYKINDIDIAYDRIKIVSIYKTSAAGVPDINIIIDEPIAGNDFLFTYTGSEITIPVSLDEFLMTNVVFRRVKTIASKANRLVAANIKTTTFDLDWDARAYRFDKTATGSLVDASGLNPIPIDPTSVAVYPNQWDVPEKHDACNPSDDPIDINGSFYQKDGVTIGGEGPNVKYTFVNPAVDNMAVLGDTHDPDALLGSGVAIPNMFGIGADNFNFDLNTTYEQFPHINAYRDYHSPYITSCLKQYLRDEIYRFGIVFFSKKGEASFVKWIADIRMPHTFMYDAVSGSRNPNGTESNYFQVADDAGLGSNFTVFYPLGVKFTVDISTIADQISGFSIVRVKREKEDRTIMDQGMLFPAFQNAAGETTTVPDDTFWTVGSWDPSSTVSIAISDEVVSFNSPEILFSKQQPGNVTGDFIEVVTLTEMTTNDDLADVNYVSQGSFKKLHKYNIIEALPPIMERYPINKSYLAVSCDEVGNPDKDYNSDLNAGRRTRNRSSGNNDGFTSIGGRTTLMRIQAGSLIGNNIGVNAINTTGDGVVELTNVVPPTVAWIANFKRIRPLQYGGKTFSQRSSNEYMLTGHFQPVAVGQNTYTDMKVYGGDTYLALFDNVKQFPMQPGFTSSVSSGQEYDQTFFVGKVFPVETTVNINLRRGIANSRAQVFNKDTITSTAFPSPTNIIKDEFFDCIDLYSSSENDLLKFHPKPDPFTAIEEFDTRIHASQAKINGELTDSWSIFKSNELIDVEGIYGPITGLFILRDKLIYTQDRAFGTAAINERILIEDSTGGQVGVGTGLVLDRYDYYSTQTGCKAIFGMVITEQGMYWIDVLSKKVYRWTGSTLECLSDARDMSAFFSSNIIGDSITNDNPFRFKGIAGVYDHQFSEIIWSLHDSEKTFTIAFNEDRSLQAFTGFYSYSTPMFCNDNYNVFAVDPLNLNRLYIQNKGDYTNFFNLGPALSTLRYVVNPIANTIKVFDNQELNLESVSVLGVDQPLDNFTRARYLTNNQNSDWRLTPSIAKRKERRWNYLVSRNRVLYTTAVPDILTDLSLVDKPYGERLRDHYLICDLEYNNLNNNELTLTAVDTLYRASAR